MAGAPLARRNDARVECDAGTFCRFNMFVAHEVGEDARMLDDVGFAEHGDSWSAATAVFICVAVNRTALSVAFRSSMRLISSS